MIRLVKVSGQGVTCDIGVCQYSHLLAAALSMVGGAWLSPCSNTGFFTVSRYTTYTHRVTPTLTPGKINQIKQ